MPRKSLRLGLALATLVASVLAGAPPAAAAAPPVELHLPAPTGPYQVGTVSLHLVDTTRTDPWQTGVKRELMVSLWYPARNAGRYPLAPWLSPGVASVFEQLMANPAYLNIPVGAVDWAGATSHGHLGAPVRPVAGGWPVVLFSPAQGTTRQLETTLVEDLASRGYVVATVDHTYEELAVEFPGSRVVPGVSIARTPDVQKKSIDSRVADSRFVLDALTTLNNGGNPDAEGASLPAGLAGALRLSALGMFGHVHGGFTTAETMVADSRVDAGITLDGPLAYSGNAVSPYVPGQAAQQGLDRPFVLFGAKDHDASGVLRDHNHANGSDPSWTAFWAVQRGFKRDLTLAGAALDTFTDFQVVLPQVSATVPVNPAVEDLFIGTIDPQRAVTAQEDYVAAVFDRFLKCIGGALLDGPSTAYPEVIFVN